VTILILETCDTSETISIIGICGSLHLLISNSNHANRWFCMFFLFKLKILQTSMNDAYVYQNFENDWQNEITRQKKLNINEL